MTIMLVTGGPYSKEMDINTKDLLHFHERRARQEFQSNSGRQVEMLKLQRGDLEQERSGSLGLGSVSASPKHGFKNDRGTRDADSGGLTSNLDRRQVLTTFMNWLDSRNQVIMGDWHGRVWLSGIGGVKGSHNALNLSHKARVVDA